MRKRFAVFCGARAGRSSVYAEAVVALTAEIGRRQGTVVYGGGRVGLMGVLADSALAAGAKVIGVIPQDFAELELAHPGLTQLHIVKNMHERKAIMAENADAFIAAPGGFGTLDELFEAITWTQLGIQHKPVGLLNVDGLFNPLKAMIEKMRDDGFISPIYVDALLFCDNAAQLLDALSDAVVPPARVQVNPSPPVN